jgi:hypothetical protein
MKTICTFSRMVCASMRCQTMESASRLGCQRDRHRCVSRSRGGVPQELGLARDPRPLDVALRQIMLGQQRTTWTEIGSCAWHRTIQPGFVMPRYDR